MRAATPALRLMIQDKPQYRPGDHAHFQLLVLDWSLKPFSGPDNTQTVGNADKMVSQRRQYGAVTPTKWRRNADKMAPPKQTGDGQQNVRGGFVSLDN